MYLLRNGRHGDRHDAFYVCGFYMGLNRAQVIVL